MAITPDKVPLLRSRLADGAPTDDQIRRGGAIELAEHSAPGLDGAPDVRLLVCTPVRFPAPRACIYYVHGGGMVAGSNRTTIDAPLDWAEAFGVTVVSVEYRLAPEHPHPAPVEDCYAGLVWLAEHANELGIDEERLVVGFSAGGGLAAAVTLTARDRGGPYVIGQLLGCPMLDDRNETVSSRQIDGVGTWDRTSNFTGWTALLGDRRGRDDVSPYAAPARATDLSGLPPTFLDAGSAEVFRDDAVAYAAGIWETGGTADLHIWGGGFHGFETLAPDTAISRAARQARSDWIERILEQSRLTSRPD